MRMYVGTIGIQALVESVNNSANGKITVYELLHLGNRSEAMFTSEVINASTSVLRKTISMARSGILRFCPVRVFFRITSICVGLLKALGLGAPQQELCESLHLLDQCIDALSSLASDDDQLWGKYAVLIKRYARQFRRKIDPSISHSLAHTHTIGSQSVSTAGEEDTLQVDTLDDLQDFDDISHLFESLDGTTDDWLTQPWDACMLPSDSQLSNS